MQDIHKKLRPKPRQNTLYKSETDDSQNYKIGVFIDHGEEGEGFLSINETQMAADIVTGGVLQGLSPFEDADLIELISPNDLFLRDYFGNSDRIKITSVNSLDSIIDSGIKILYICTAQDRPFGAALLSRAEDRGIPVQCHVFKRGSNTEQRTEDEAVTESKSKTAPYKSREVGGIKGYVSRGANYLIPRKIITKDGVNRTYYFKSFVQKAVKHAKGKAEASFDFFKQIGNAFTQEGLSKYATASMYLSSIRGRMDDEGHGLVPAMFRHLGSWRKDDSKLKPNDKRPNSNFYLNKMDLSERNETIRAIDNNYAKSVLSRDVASSSRDKSTIVFLHEEDGVQYEETALEYHKRHKSGGASDSIIAAYADETVRMMLEKDGIMPDMIITPPITWKGEDEAIYGTRENKISMSIHHRTAKMISDNYRVFYDRKTNQVVPAIDVVKRYHSGTQDSMYSGKNIAYDPMLMGEKQAEAKKMTDRIKIEGQHEHAWQQSLDVRYQHIKEVLLSSLGLAGKLKTKEGKLQFDKDGKVLREEISPEELQKNKKAFSEKLKGVKNIAILDDNVDKAATLRAMHDIIKTYAGTSVEIAAYSLFDMKTSVKSERETPEALLAKEEEGRALFELRRDHADEFNSASPEEKRMLIDTYIEDMRKRNSKRAEELNVKSKKI